MTSPDSSASPALDEPPSLDDRELLDLLLGDEATEQPLEPTSLRPSNAPEFGLLSRAQRRLWFLQQIAPESAAYNIFCAARLSGRLNLDALRSAFRAIADRHQPLRTCFPAIDGRPTVHLRDEEEFDIPIDDLRATNGDIQSEAVSRLCAQEAARPFDLNTGPLLRVRLLRLSAHEHIVLLSMHHIVADGWSMGVLLNELREFYGAFLQGRPLPLPKLQLQYSDFAQWQEEWLASKEARKQHDWWKERLARLTTLELPIDRLRPTEATFRGGALAFRVPLHVAAVFRTMARRNGATLFMALLAAFAVLLHRYTAQTDIAIGSPVANRNRRVLEPLIGLFVNSLVMRCDLSGEPDFLTVLRRVRDFTLEALAHQDLPFEEVINELAPERDTSSNPLFQVMFSLENIPGTVLQLPELVLTSVEVETHIAKFDLLLNMGETSDGGFAGAFEYSADLFERGTIERMARHFGVLLEAIAASPQARISQLALLAAHERTQVLVGWNRTATAYPADRCIHELFEAEARRDPDATAVVFGEERLSYGALDARANALARRLRALGVGDGRTVALVVERSVEMVVALLGILKAGYAYAPLSPDDPDERLSLLLADLAPAAILTQGRFAGRLRGAARCPVLCLDEMDWPQFAAAGAEGAPRHGSGPDGLAYVLYTSGSTGAPKGVCVHHRSVVRLVKDTGYVEFGRSDVFLQLAPLAFDASTFELWGALLNGGTLAVAPPGRLSLAEIGAAIRRYRVSTLWLTAGLFQVMVDERLSDLSPLRQLLVGGDVLPVAHVRRALAALPECRLINGYGPTENTTFTCCHAIAEPLLGSVPIGRPIANTRVYILDGQLQPVPVGVAGELCTSGAGLARGYLNRPDLTAERFIANPFSGFDGESRLYRTGDTCRYLADGTIEFLGRRDQQVKIRGFRVEPGEIETAIVTHHSIQQAAVVAQEDHRGRRELVAYLVAGSDFSVEALRQELAEKLSGYMVPAKYIVLQALPLTENGKVDRAALPRPREATDYSEARELPRDAREECLAHVWQEVLGRQAIGIHENYFHLGGDSITAIQVVSRLRRHGWQVRVTDVFRHPTVAELAPCLQEADENGHEPVEGAAHDVPLTAIQRWFFENHEGDLNHFNQAIVLRSAPRLDADHLRLALAELLRRHDALRMRFSTNGMVRQTCVPAGEPSALEVIDLGGALEPEAALKYANEVHRGLDLEHGPLMRAVLFQMADGDRLLLVIHHLAVDAVSWRILVDELELAIRQSATGEAIALGPRSCSFRHWAEKIREFAATGMLSSEAEYWSQVEGASVTRLPTVPVSASLRHGEAQTVHRALSAEDTTELLTRAHRAFDTDIMDLMLTALGRALKRWSGGEATRITLEGHGREQLGELHDLSRTVGWFTSLYPFVLSVPGEDVGEQILGVKARRRKLSNKGVGYGILRYIAGRRFVSDTPQLSFNYLGQVGEAAGDGRVLRYSDESSGCAIAPHLARVHELDVTGLVAGGRLILSLTFDPRGLAHDAAVALLEDFDRELTGVARYCLSRPQDEETPPILGKPSSVSPPVVPDAEDVYPLSPLQEGFLFQSLLEPGSDSYYIQVRLKLTGRLNPEAFRQAWYELCQRHAVLRTVFVSQDGPHFRQTVLKKLNPDVTFADLRSVSNDERAARLDAFCVEDRRRGFDLARGPLVRVAVFRLSESDYHVVWSYHHILLDGWCLAILQRDFLEFYASLLVRRPARLPAVVPYRSYILWLAAQDQDRARAFWRQYLEGYEEAATLPKLPRAGAPSARRLAEETLVLDPERSAQLAQFAARAGVTVNAVMLSVWGLLLARYNDRDEVVFGTIVSGRPAELPGVEDVVGLFIGAIPVRIAVKPGMSFSALARAVQDDALLTEPNRHLPLGDIQLQGPLGRNLFDHMLIFENYPFQASGTETALKAPIEFALESVHDTTHYDLDLTIVPGAQIAIKFTFNLQVYPADQMRRTVAHMRSAVDGVIRNPGQRLKDVAILPPPEQDLLLHSFNDTHASYPREKSIVDLFENEVARRPDAVAVRCGDVELSYRDLNDRANRLAHRLRSLGVGPGVAVGLCVERSIEMIAGPLAIMKAGGIFVPLEPDYPERRLAFMLADSGVSVLLTQQQLAERLSGHSATVVLLDREAPATAARPGDNPVRCGDADQTAYVIYTSGSTGQPKGVAVAHASITNLAFALRGAYGLADFPVRLLQMASMSFDVFIGDLARALANGGLLVVCPKEALVDPPAIYELLSANRISIFESTPTLVLPLMDYIHRHDLPVDFLKVLVIGSEPLPALQFQMLQERFGNRLRLINSYGVTEATIDSSFFEATPSSVLDPAANTPIGRPLGNVRLHVLNRHRGLQPLGAPGELYIGGEGVATCYLNRPDLTAERFVIGPSGERLYRTGDRARWLPDGNVEFLGRIDDQVKIRGNRIELKEIERALVECASVAQAVVIARSFGADTELAAYVVADARWDAGLVRESLNQSLPSHMVPAFLVRLDTLPTTPNGKVDRNALPEPHTGSKQASTSPAPASPTEVALAAIWRRVLQRDQIGALDDFFELGGHSLKALQIVNQVRKEFGVQVLLREFFAGPTISALASLIGVGAKIEWASIPVAPQQETYELSHAQRRLWMLHHMEGATAYNMPEAHLIDAEIDVDVLNRAFRTLIGRHETLRTAIVLIDGEPHQQVWPEVSFSVTEFDLRQAEEAERQARDIADRHANSAFDLTTAPLLRAGLVRLPMGRTLFLLTMHHIIGDGWSGNLVYRELLSLYDAYRHGRANPFKPLHIQYKDFAHWQNARGWAREERYWQPRVADMPECLLLPYDFAPEGVRDFRGGNASIELSGAVAGALRRLAVKRGTTLSNVILALFKLLLFHWTRQSDICVGISVANRNHPDLENLIGFFVNVLPIRCRLDADMDFDDLLTLVVERTGEAMDHQDYPFDLMIQKLNPVRRANRQPLVNVLYAFQNFADVHVDVERKVETSAQISRDPEGAPGWTAFDFSFQTSKFDLTLFVLDEADKIRLIFEYDDGLFLAKTIHAQLHSMAEFAGMI